MSADWILRGLCSRVEPDIFFPENDDALAAAKAVCGSCPVRPDCLRWALDAGEKGGVWGGLTEPERRALPKVRASN
jgi:WhiB family redox-sensing transcriptional regulator